MFYNRRKFVPPFPPAYLSVTRTAVQSIPNAAFTVVQLNTIVHQFNIDFNAATFTATIIEDGIYIVGFVGQYASNAVGIRAHQIMINGVREYAVEFSAPLGNPTIPLEAGGVPSQFLAGDTISVQTEQTSGAALNLAVSAKSPELGIVKLGNFNP